MKLLDLILLLALLATIGVYAAKAEDLQKLPPPAYPLIDAQGRVVCKDVDKILEILQVHITDCCFDAECKIKGKCGVFKPVKYDDIVHKDEIGREYYRVYKGDYVGLEDRVK